VLFCGRHFSNLPFFDQCNFAIKNNTHSESHSDDLVTKVNWHKTILLQKQYCNIVYNGRCISLKLEKYTRCHIYEPEFYNTKRTILIRF